jgi:hypothetical protein
MNNMVTVYCYSEGDLHYFEHGDDVHFRGDDLDDAFPVVTGRFNRVKGIIDKESVVRIFSGVEIPTIETVNDLSKSNDSMGAVDVFIKWVNTLKEKYSDVPVSFHC